VGRLQHFLIDAINNYLVSTERYCEMTYFLPSKLELRLVSTLENNSDDSLQVM
jgi:hypothetical protein